MLNITTIQAVKEWIGRGALEPATIIGLDLMPLTADFKKISVADSLFIGCETERDLSLQIAEQGGRRLDDSKLLPKGLSAFRSSTYTVSELYAGMAVDGSGWEKTPDYGGYRWYNVERGKPRVLDLAQMVAARLHDSSQERAVRELLQDRKVVAVMGGHDFQRQTDTYWDCVSIAKALTEERFFILSGGGPGLMEAANLGALLANSTKNTVSAVRRLLTDEGFETSEWRGTAAAARALILGSRNAEPEEAQWSLGVPTWLYGHEPPNLFASHHAKMFYNSLREDGLVTWANAGIIYFEGNAGTVQEVFQDATQNYYRAKDQSPSPMVFYNANQYWNRSCDDISWPTDDPMNKRKPLLPLIKQLALEKNFASSVLVTDSPQRVLSFLEKANREVSQPRVADFKLGNLELAKLVTSRDG
jgi:predicted Rossmann-fold nucleotide-binding protein